MKKRTTEEFKKLVYDLTGDEYTVLGEYTTTLTKIQMRHNKCGTEFTPTPARFLEGLEFVKVTPSFKNYWIKHWKTGEENVIKNREPMYHKDVMSAQAAGMGWPIYNAGTKTYIYEPSRTE